MLQAWEQIVVLKGTAGQAILLGQKNVDGHWLFKRELDHLSNYDDSLPMETTDSFKEALSQLGPSWKYLKPVFIHPEFKAVLWAYIKLEKGLHSLTEWRKACM